MLPNGVSAASVFLGAMYAGYVVSPISLLAQDSQIEYTLSHSETRIVFAAPEFVDRLRTLVARVGSRAVVRPTPRDEPGFAAPMSAARRGGPSPEAETPALLMYTSGTTGVPKGALLSHANMIHAGLAVCESLSLTAADRVPVFAAAVSHQWPMCGHGEPARVGRCDRHAAPIQRFAVVDAGRALPSDVDQRRADDHRLSLQMDRR
jgi:acyl-CoA synthetase (AMP-forming)/AMP-acid ligase II